jgi:multicomponent Na+:H+ antiporter subunit D
VLTRRERAALLAPIVGLAGVTLAIGLWVEPFSAFAMEAGAELLSRRGYVEAVLGSAP